MEAFQYLLVHSLSRNSGAILPPSPGQLGALLQIKAEVWGGRHGRTISSTWKMKRNQIWRLELCRDLQIEGYSVCWVSSASFPLSYCAQPDFENILCFSDVSACITSNTPLFLHTQKLQIHLMCTHREILPHGFETFIRAVQFPEKTGWTYSACMYQWHSTCILFAALPKSSRSTAHTLQYRFAHIQPVGLVQRCWTYWVSADYKGSICCFPEALDLLCVHNVVHVSIFLCENTWADL